MDKEKIFETLWRNKWITANAKTIDDFITTFESLADMFKEWKEAGIKLETDSGIEDDYATFLTKDPVVASKYNFDLRDEEDELD
jgi:hypothetical protein